LGQGHQCCEREQRLPQIVFERAGKVVELSKHQSKPDPGDLLEICARERVAPEEASYVGDSVARDILMAKRANVFSMWAAYGAQHDPEMYSQLVRISHWTFDEVAREQRLKEEAKNIQPDYVARTSFAEVLTVLDIKRSFREVGRG
jgi:phosphoglycolate phosphatase-like HAD superfamily hydrolase